MNGVGLRGRSRVRGGLTALGVGLGEVVHAQAVAVEARERDELPHEAALGELVRERADLRVQVRARVRVRVRNTVRVSSP